MLPVSVPGVKTEQGNSEKAAPWLCITLNCAIFVSFLVTVNAYALGRWEVFFGPIHFTVSRGLKPVFVLLLFALLRWIVAIRGKRIGGDLRAVVSSPWFSDEPVVKKMRLPQITGDDCPSPTAVFHKMFESGPK